jgi:hypothetical protein
LPSNILHHATLTGFKGINEWGLDLLLRHFGHSIINNKLFTKGVLSKVEALIRLIRPTISEAELHQCLMARCPKKSGEDTVLSTLMEAASCSDELLEGTDNKAVKEIREKAATEDHTTKTVRHYIASKPKVLGGGGPDVLAAPAAGAGASSSSAAVLPAVVPPIAPRVILRHEWPQHIADAKKLMPPVIGSILQPYPKKNAFQAYYPNPVPPKSIWCKYSAGGSTGSSPSVPLHGFCFIQVSLHFRCGSV